ncbi:MAG TPA: Gfo/Idh/MocA family oxidoreductase, partial [Methylomirabilota bacterium]
MLRLGVIGFGYWGPNLVRNFQAQPDCRVVAICDRTPAALARAQAQCPGIPTTADSAEVLTAPGVDAVAIATPVSTHYTLARVALDHGKHVFVEKPLTAASEEADDLIERAERARRVLMVDHTFLFTGAVRKIKELVDAGVLGRLYYYDSTRVNLGLFQHDVNVVWDLAPHDFAVIDHLLGLEPEHVVATGQAHLNGHEDLAYITLYFPNDVIAHVNVNWLSPMKVRTTLLGGDKKMLVWNDLEPT